MFGEHYAEVVQKRKTLSNTSKATAQLAGLQTLADVLQQLRQAASSSPSAVATSQVERLRTVVTAAEGSVSTLVGEFTQFQREVVRQCAASGDDKMVSSQVDSCCARSLVPRAAEADGYLDSRHTRRHRNTCKRQGIEP